MPVIMKPFLTISDWTNYRFLLMLRTTVSRFINIQRKILRKINRYVSQYNWNFNVLMCSF